MDCSAECFTPRRRSLPICKPGPSTLCSHRALGTGRRGEANRTHKICLVYLQQSHEPPPSSFPASPLGSFSSPSPLTLSSHTHPVPGPLILSGNSDLSSPPCTIYSDALTPKSLFEEPALSEGGRQSKPLSLLFLLFFTYFQAAFPVSSPLLPSMSMVLQPDGTIHDSNLFII